MQVVLAIIIGSMFGYALYLVGASSTKTLTAMLRLEELELMKIIVFAIGFASILLSLFALFGWINIGHLSVKTTHLGVIIGGLLFGIGFGSIGTCPGTCVAAAGGGGGRKAIAAILGGLFGAWVFSMTYEFWLTIGLFDIMNLGKLTLFNISDKYPSVLHIGYEGLILVGLMFLGISVILPISKNKK